MISDCYSGFDTVLPAPRAMIANLVARDCANGIAYSTLPERTTLLNVVGIPEATLTHVPDFSSLQTTPDLDAIRAHVVDTSHVRFEMVRCRSQSVVNWRAAGSGMYLMLIRTRAEELRISFSGGPSEYIGSGCAKFWFFPDATGAQGEMRGRGPFDCVGVSVGSSVVPSALKTFFTTQ